MSGIRALIFDWAGTTVDHGSLAPVLTLERVLVDAGVRVPQAVIRRDMGLAKLDHIARLLREPETVAAWQAAHGEAPPASAVDALYAAFLPLQMECLVTYSHVLDGVPEAVARFRAIGLRIGSTTGYTRAMLDALVASAALEGYAPEIALSPEDVGAGRPSPAMCLEICRRFEVAPEECIKIGDTVSDIEEGRNAGMWTIGVTRTGNMIGLSHEDWLALPRSEQQERLAAAKAEFDRASAHEVAESVADCLPQIRAIQQRLDGGERP
jgi:phosphonoacetaldehyde hydrolase